MLPADRDQERWVTATGRQTLATLGGWGEGRAGVALEPLEVNRHR